MGGVPISGTLVPNFPQAAGLRAIGENVDDGRQQEYEPHDQIAQGREAHDVPGAADPLRASVLGVVPAHHDRDAGHDRSDVEPQIVHGYKYFRTNA